MAYLQIPFITVTSLILLSILYLRTYAVTLGTTVERRYLTCGLSTLNATSCRKVCVTAFWDEECSHEVAPWDDFATTLEVTDGAIRPLIWPPGLNSLGNGTIRGIKYLYALTETATICKPILFIFYNSENQIVERGRVLMTPGQGPRECEVIPNAVAYAGVIDLETIDAIPLGSATSFLSVNTRNPSTPTAFPTNQQFSSAASPRGVHVDQSPGRRTALWNPMEVRY
jgi:hypothetical protein